MKILSVNAGSSSLKFQMYEMPEERVLIQGVFERIGIEGSMYTIKINGEKIKKEVELSNHEVAVKILIEELFNYNVISSLEEIKGVGHRVVHGGNKYSNSVVINDDVIAAIDELCDLAPLHNPANLLAIKAFITSVPEATQVAVFDTAFFQTLEEEAYIYPVPYEWYKDYSVRKYGFHGISHKYLTSRVSELEGREDINIITCHLGNGASIGAIKNGVAIDTTLGFTPNSGLMMGTRSGDIDSGIIPYIVSKKGVSLTEVMNDLTKKSGYLGISQKSSDSRDIEDGIKAGDEQCILAQKIYVKRVASYIANFNNLLDGADVICFAGGIGENSCDTRAEVMKSISSLGVILDEEANNVRGKEALISKPESKIKCYIIPTDEEVMIARDTYDFSK